MEKKIKEKFVFIPKEKLMASQKQLEELISKDPEGREFLEEVERISRIPIKEKKREKKRD